MDQFPKTIIYLGLALALVIAFTVFVLQRGLTGPDSLSEDHQVDIRRPAIEINFGLLENEKVESLNLFEKAPEFDQKPGRENPFSFYGTSTATTTAQP